jgi:cobalt-zinc-cadmium efflux system membrane fusion protein
VLVYLLYTPAQKDEPRKVVAAPTEQVTLKGGGLIGIDPQAPLAKKLEIVCVETVSVTDPVLQVTGTVVASRRPGGTNNPDVWQFDSPELLTTYADLEKAAADIAFAATQLERVKELVMTRDTAQAEVVARLKKLVAGGTESVKDERVAETSLLEFKIEGQKEIHEAETAVKLARRSEAALIRRFQQAGLDPDLFKDATPDTDIVLAEVPEGKLARVSRGQTCKATFFGFPGRVFTGKVTSLSPVLLKDRRTLQALFVIHDPEDLLRPGMFAEIGLGTDARSLVAAPADGVVHIGREDYLLKRTSAAVWQMARIEAGELIGANLEILSGVQTGDHVLGKGAILLKPFMIRALRQQTAPPVAVHLTDEVVK